MYSGGVNPAPTDLHANCKGKRVKSLFHHRLHGFIQINYFDNQLFKIKSVFICVICGEL